MSSRQPPEDPFERIIRGNSWDDVPRDDEDLEPWAEDFPWEPREQPAEEIPVELRDTREDERYEPDPGPVTSGISPAMLRALSTVLAVIVIMVGLALLPGSLPPVMWLLGLVGLVTGLYLIFRALPQDSPEDDDGAVV